MSASPLSRRAFLGAVGLTGAAASSGAIGTFGLSSAQAAIPGPGSYSASWASVDQHPAAPEWFQDAKFGIYYHWGAFSVPAYGNEWYPRRMYISGDACNSHHKSTYGDPSSWPYSNFINGARDKSGNFVQFAPKLKSAGGKFDPNEWAQLFVDAGAKFAGPVAEHHDGFSMWDSAVNEWNSVDKGPKLNLLKLHTDAIRAKGLKLLVAMHHAYNFTGYYDHAPGQSSTVNKKLYGQLGASAENQLWYDKLKEVIDQAQPDILWEDFNLRAVEEKQRLNFLSYYYNQAVKWGKEVVATYKDGFDTKGEIYDYERGGPGGITTPYWLTDDAVSSSSWSYKSGMSYYSTTAVLHALIDRVSKNGNMLLNISPIADGTIPQAQRDILLTIGAHLKRAGESIYSTRAWSSYGEGPTKMGGGSGFSAPKAGTSRDIRFTRSKDSRVLYATVLGWPGGSINISSLGSSRISLKGLTSVQLLGNTAGSYTTLAHSQSSSGLNVTLPAQPYSGVAYVIKLTFSGTIGGAPGSGGAADPTPEDTPTTTNTTTNTTTPTTGLPTGWTRVTNVTSGLVLDSGGNVSSGSNLKQWKWNGSTNLQWQFVSLGNGYYRINNRTNGMAANSNWATTNNTLARQSAYRGSNNQQWKVTDIGGGKYMIVARGGGLALDSAGTVASGAVTILWTPNGGSNQQWTISAV